MARKKLDTSPNFAATHLDSHVHLVPAPADEDVADLDSSTEVELRVSSLSAAANGVVSINPEEPIARAYTEMALNDFSQLAVMPSERSLTGHVSWESIGLANLAHMPSRVRDCTLPARTVELNDPLLPLLAEIAEKNFVFVKARDGRMSGIITASDITLESGDVARPYLLVGEIERRLRRVADQNFEKGEIVEAAHNSHGKAQD